MFVPIVAITINALTVCFATCLLAAILSSRRQTLFHRSVAGGVGATLLVSAGGALSLFDDDRAAFWLRILMLGQLAQAVAFSAIGPALLRQASGKWTAGIQWFRFVAVVAGVFAVALWSSLILPASPWAMEVTVIETGSLSVVFHAFMLIAMAMSGAQLLALLQILPDPLRFQIKFVVIGFGGLAGFEIYIAGQFLLLPVWESDLLLAGGIINALSLGLVTIGLIRTRAQQIIARVYVSPLVLVRSFAIVAVGIGMGVVGFAAQWLHWNSREWGFVVGIITAFGGTVAIVLLLISRSARIAVRHMVARHFYRSKHDYRLKWLEVTEAFQGADTVDLLLDRLLTLLARTFSASRISLWLRFEADQCFHQVRSLNDGIPPKPLERASQLVRRLEAEYDPFHVAAEPLGERVHRDKTLYAPVRSQGQLIAFLALSCDANGQHYDYDVDDCDLLRAAAHHVGLLLANAHWAEEKAIAAKLEAVHRLSTFCLHDLKNLTNKLSLVAQNAEAHGAGPVFQRSAMNTVRATIQQMTDLITKLSLKSAVREEPGLVEVNGVVTETANLFGRSPIVTVLSDVPRVKMGRDQLQQILAIIVENAQQAGEASGEVVVTTEVIDGCVVIGVADRGVGISPDRLRTLFHPFKSTKRHGMGVGLYQCKSIVEMLGGSLQIQSRLGLGTTVWIKLPVADSSVLGGNKGVHAFHSKRGEYPSGTY